MTVAAALNRLLGLIGFVVQRGVVRNTDPEAAVTTSSIPTAGRIYWMRLREGGRIGAVRFQVTTASGNLCIAYAHNTTVNDRDEPGVRIATTGTVACPASGSTTIAGGANGDHEIDLDGEIVVKAGDWVGIAADATTQALRCTTGAGAVDSILATGTSYRETISAGSPAIPSARSTLTPHITKNWLIVGV